MTNDEIIKTLKEERVKVCERKASVESEIQHCDTRIAQIDAAIESLGGTVQKKVEVSVVSIIEASARSMNAGTVFDHVDLKRMATNMYPHLAEKIKTGVYNAVSQLLKKKKFIRAVATATKPEGGFTLAP